MAWSDRCSHRCTTRDVLLMSNHQNEEIKENLYDEEYHRLEKKYPQLNAESIATLARYFAMKRWEEME